MLPARVKAEALRAWIEKSQREMALDGRCAPGLESAKRPSDIARPSAQNPKTHTGRADFGSDETADYTDGADEFGLLWILIYPRYPCNPRSTINGKDHR
jgi:hypothetical protein